jgi:hypothetical protein
MLAALLYNDLEVDPKRLNQKGKCNKYTENTRKSRKHRKYE